MKILMRNQLVKKWETVESADYTAEKELQKLLSETPSLITIDEIRDNASPLVAAVREVGLPGSGFTDLLAFSADGDIVLVECKLAANIEIKRKVIAQLLEYGAYLWNMTYDDLNNVILQKTNKDLAELVGEAAGDPEWNEEEFRGSVQSTLEKGSFILIIAVDEMNEELTRTIRFLNTCGSPSFTFTAFEMRRFQKDNTEILVPHLFEVASPKKTKAGGQRKRWTEAQFFEAVRVKLSPEVAMVIKDLFGWCKSKADRVWFGTGVENGSFTFHHLQDGKTFSIFSVYTNGLITLNYGWLSTIVEQGQMEWFHQAITAIPGFKNVPADFKRWPSMKIEDALNKPQDIDEFKMIVEEFEKRIR